MRIDVALWYRLITKGVITLNCYDRNSTVSSSMPTSLTPSNYIQYDQMQSDGVRPNEIDSFSPTSSSRAATTQINNVNDESSEKWIE